jgi:hypothetical protein
MNIRVTIIEIGVNAKLTRVINLEYIGRSSLIFKLFERANPISYNNEACLDFLL